MPEETKTKRKIIKKKTTAATRKKTHTQQK